MDHGRWGRQGVARATKPTNTQVQLPLPHTHSPQATACDTQPPRAPPHRDRKHNAQHVQRVTHGGDRREAWTMGAGDGSQTKQRQSTHF